MHRCCLRQGSLLRPPARHSRKAKLTGEEGSTRPAENKKRKSARKSHFVLHLQGCVARCDWDVRRC